MFDPTYEQNPKAAEQSIQAVLRPPAKHKSKKSHAKPAHAAKSAGNVAKAPTAASPIGRVPGSSSLQRVTLERLRTSIDLAAATAALMRHLKRSPHPFAAIAVFAIL